MSDDAQTLLESAARSPKGSEVVVVVEEAEGSSSSRRSSEEVETTTGPQRDTTPPAALIPLSPRQLEKQPARSPLPNTTPSPTPDDRARKRPNDEKDPPNPPKWGGRRLKGLILSDSTFWGFEPTSASPPRLHEPTTATAASEASDRLSRLHLHGSPRRDCHPPQTSQIEKQHTSSVLPEQLELDVRIGSMRNVLFPTRFSHWQAAEDAHSKPRRSLSGEDPATPSSVSGKS